ncbi:hypothetical protein KGP36_02560 [Patescibacteria group bacterium]|nr:hypothetical protein [Patescibacteria group bacterium]
MTECRKLDKHVFEERIRAVAPTLADRFLEGEEFFGGTNLLFSLLPVHGTKVIWVTGLWAPDPKKTWECIRALAQWAKQCGLEGVGFTTNENNKSVVAIAKYTKAIKLGVDNGNILYVAPVDIPRWRR